MQLLNGNAAQNIVGVVGQTLNNFDKLSSLQIKVMQEVRKSIMSMNEVTNPKRTTFIKEANRHNHLHQNSENKYDNENELQKQLDKPDETIESVSSELKENFHEEKL